MKIKIKIYNVTTIFLFVTILALQNFAQLIPTSTYLVPSFLKFSDIGVLMAIGWTIWVYFFTKTSKKIKYAYGAYVITFFILVIISSYMAEIFFGQPLSYGIRSQRYQLVCFLLYFPITRALQIGLLKRKDLISMIFIVGTFELIVYILQYLLVNVASFTYINLGELRNGTSRLRFPYLLPLVMGMFSINNLLNSNGKKTLYKVRNIIYVVMSAFLLMIICQHRAPSLILVITWGVAYFLWKKNIGKKILIGLVVGMCALAILSNLTIVQDAINTLQNKNSVSNTLNIREQGQLYYKAKLQESPAFGFGVPNLNCPTAVLASGQQYSYFLADNGIMGFIYIFGITGVIWLILLMLKSYKMSFFLYNKKKIYMYLLYFIFETGNLYIGMHWYYYYTFPFVFMLAMLDYDTWVLKGELKDE